MNRIMKKLLTIIALFVFCVTVNAQNTKQQETQLEDNTSSTPIKVNKNIQSGDVNGDGEISITDFVIVIEFIISGSISDDFHKDSADMDGDGEITFVDCGLLKNKILDN